MQPLTSKVLTKLLQNFLSLFSTDVLFSFQMTIYNAHSKS